jgi:anti-sigma factor RsiW
MSIEPYRAAMDCSELERAIDAYWDGELDDRERAEAEAHLSVCAPCRRRADAQGRVRLALRSRLQETLGARATPAPAALRERVTAALARERRPLWRRVLSPIPVAAAAACAAGALVVLVWHGGDAGLVAEAVKKHNRDLPLEVMTASVGVDSIPAWFEGKLDFRPAPPRFGKDGVRLVGARLSHLREWPAAYMRYELPRGKAGLFIVDDPDGRFDATGREVKDGVRTIRLQSANGYNVAVWRDDEIVYSLVSDLDEAALFELVRTAQRERRR